MGFTTSASATTSESKEGTKGAPEFSVGISSEPVLHVENNNINIRKIETETNSRHEKLYYLLEEADQLRSADEEDCCWI